MKFYFSFLFNTLRFFWILLFALSVCNVFAESLNVSVLDKADLGIFFISQTRGIDTLAGPLPFYEQILNSKAYVISCDHCNEMPNNML